MLRELKRKYRLPLEVALALIICESWYIAIVRKPPCELNVFLLQQQHNLVRTFGTSKMHLTPPPHPSGLVCWPFSGGGSVVVDALLIATAIVGFCNCSMFCFALHHDHCSRATILMGKRELVTLLSLSSRCLVIVVWHFRSAIGMSVVFDCGILWSYSLFQRIIFYFFN